MHMRGALPQRSIATVHCEIDDSLLQKKKQARAHADTHTHLDQYTCTKMRVALLTGTGATAGAVPCVACFPCSFCCFAPPRPSLSGEALFSSNLKKKTDFFIILNLRHMHEVLNIN
jgi:hypothetical protein